jgi:hypothetical protein
MRNPAVKLLPFFIERYDYGLGEMDWEGYLLFETHYAERDSETMRNLPDLVHEGYVGKFVECWLRDWTK